MMDPRMELAMTPDVQAFFYKPTNTFSYVVSDPEMGAAAIIDPVLNYDFKSGRTDTDSASTLAAFIRNRWVSIGWILEKRMPMPTT